MEGVLCVVDKPYLCEQKLPAVAANFAVPCSAGIFVGAITELMLGLVCSGYAYVCI